MKSPPPSSRRASVANKFRGEIERIEAEGVARGKMTLRLTFGDMHQLKRDPDLALDDISFAGGVMRFLGVKVEQGGVPASELCDHPTVVAAPVAKPTKAKAKAKAKPKTAKAAKTPEPAGAGDAGVSNTAD